MRDAQRRKTQLVVTLELTGMAPTGEAIGRHEGLIVFVPFGLPGERVHVRLVTQKRSFARGEIVERLTAALERVAPVCPYFGICGGCDWQHITYSEQLRFKTAAVAEQFTRIGKLTKPPVLPCVASPSIYEYRNHARLQVTAEGKLGYRAARSHAIVAVNDCPILEPVLREQVAAPVAGSAEAGAASELVLRSWSETITVGGFAYRAEEGAFFQANTAVAELLVGALLAALSPTGVERVLDLYCGVGLFTVPVGRRVAQIAGVESNAVAAANAACNLEAAQVAGSVFASEVAAMLCSSPLADQPWDAVILDPPRTGVDERALAALAALQAPRLFYISCEPATLARDVQLLTGYGYRLQWAQPFDMFPQTRHVETLAVLAAT